MLRSASLLPQSRRRPRFAGVGASVNQEDSSATENDACSDQCRPRPDRAGTNLSYCNGEIGPGSSNITLYIVWPSALARWVAHTLQHMPSLRLREGRGGRTARATMTIRRSVTRINLY